MVLVPEVVDAVGPDVPVLAAGGIGCGRQMAAALALGAQGVWTGSIWLTVAEADTSAAALDNLLAATSRDTVRSRVDDGQAGAAAAHRLDRGVGARRHARPAAHAAPGHRVRRRGPARSAGCRSTELSGFPGRPDRRPHEPGAPDADVIFDMVEEWIETTQRLNNLIDA